MATTMSAQDDVQILLEELATDAPTTPSASITVRGPSGEVVFDAGSSPVIDTNVPEVACAEADGYLQHFNEITSQLDSLDAIVGQIATAGDQDARLANALRFISNQQELNEKMYILLVKMDAALSK